MDYDSNLDKIFAVGSSESTDIISDSNGVPIAVLYSMDGTIDWAKQFYPEHE